MLLIYRPECPLLQGFDSLAVDRRLGDENANSRRRSPRCDRNAAGSIPLVGDLIVGAVLPLGLGAVVVTYFGATHFRPAVLPE
jgi:hypothetical protein